MTKHPRPRTEPYATEHQASVRHRPETPRSFAALSAWFRAEWEAALPTRMHTRGVEADSVLGSPTLAPAMRARIANVSDRGWMVTGWDRDGNPRRVTDDGYTIDPFLFYLEKRLRAGEVDAKELVRWAYAGFDSVTAALFAFRRKALASPDLLPAPDELDQWEASAYEALLERGMRKLWDDCQREPVRHSVCPDCRRGRCACGDRSESQINAEEAAAT